jgi:glucose/arabinose dehydrogenase/PKD repeat protein
MNFTTISATWRRVSLSLFVGLLFTSTLLAQLPNGFTDVKMQGGYAAPMGIAFNPNGQYLFVWEKNGKLWVSKWNGTSYVKPASPTLDISEEVGDWRDFGLQSVALDPNFDSNGLIYLFYQVDRHHLINFGTPQYSATTNEYFKASISRLTRYKINGNGTTYTADLTSRRILLGETKSTGVPLVHESHAGGQIVFGTDGTLMVSTGDNASYASTDVGSASETYWQQAINDGIMRSTENVGSFRSQQINSFCGKVLRLDPNTGDAIASNPYYESANPRSAKSRVWALGLRNPYRMSFKTGTGSTNRADGNPGTLIVGDVQWTAWEDMHMLEKGGLNCGWPLFEGIEAVGGYASAGTRNGEEAGNPTFQSLCVQATSATVNATPSQRRYTHFPPFIDWKHGNSASARAPQFNNGTISAVTIGSAGSHATGNPFSGNCVTSGDFYKGTNFPTQYRGAYFFGDYSSNWIKVAVVHDNSTHQLHQILDFAPAGYCKGLVDLEYCPLDGSMFYVNINTGDIQKITAAVTNRPPVAAIGSDKTSWTSPLTVAFSSAGSSDPDGNPITYEWDFGDGSAKSTAANPSHTFTANGTQGFTVRLTVRDNQGLSDSKTLTISLNNTPPSVKITTPTSTYKYTLASATSLTLQSNVTDNDVTGMQYAWQVTLRHNTHEHREPIINQQSPTVQISPVGCDGETYYYLIDLQVTDRGGLTAKDSVKIYPDCNSQNLSITNLSATAQTNAVATAWTNPSIAFDEVMVIAKANSGFTTNPNGTTYTADANFGGNGSAFEGGKVVYRGTGAGVTVTGLTAGTRYYFRVFTRKGTTWTGGVEASAVPNGVTVPPSTCSGGLRGSYYNNKTFTGTPVLTRNEAVWFDWATGSPGANVPADNFSVRWEGQVEAPVTGTYTFYITADDGVRLWVNNQLLVDKYFDQAPTEYTATISLTAGQKYPVRVDFFETGGGAVAKLDWAYPNQARQAVPAGRLCATTTTDPCVAAPSVGGTIAPASQSITTSANGIVPTRHTLSGHVGTIVRWEWQAPNSTVWNNWNGGGSTSAPNNCCFSTVGTWKVRAIIKNNTCSEVPSSEGLIVVTNGGTTTPSPVSCVGNLIQNFSFESDLTGYANWENNSTTISTTDARSGSKAAKIIPQGGFGYTVDVQAGATYTLKGWAKISGSVAWSGIGLAFYDVNWNKIANSEVNKQITTTTYAEYIVTATVPVGAVRMTAYTWKSGATGQVCTDDWCLTGTANAAFSATKCYRFNARHSGKVMEVASSITTNGGNVQQWTWNGTKTQVWRIKDIGAGFYQIVNGNSSRVLDVSGVSTANGANIHQWDWTGGDNQRWKLTRNTEGYYVITAKHSGQAVDVYGAGTQDGANITQYPVTNTANQQFQIVETGCPTGTVALQSANILTAQGYRDGKKGVITWVSNAKEPRDYFVVQKMNANEPVFEKLEYLDAQIGHPDEKQYYSIVDDEPTDGVNTYRVVLYRAGETIPQYSELITLDFSHLTDFALFPNPADDYVDVDLEAVRFRHVHISVVDLAGKMVLSQKVESAPTVLRVSLEGLQTGQYLMQIEAEGKRVVMKKLVITR